MERSTSEALQATEKTAGALLAERVFVPQVRCGFTYVAPAEPVASPLVHQRPVKPVLQPLNQDEFAADRKAGVKRMVRRLVGTLIVTLVLSWTAWGDWLAPAAFVVGVTFTIAAVVSPRLRSNEIVAAHQQRGAELDAQHEVDLARWKAEVDRHDEAERNRYASTPRWFPVPLRPGWSRVDVFGGTSDGWASLLTTLGPSIMGSGKDALVLDFSENAIAGDLVDFCRSQNVPVSQVWWPSRAAGLDLLAGLSPEDVGELVAHVASPGSGEDAARARNLDADLVEAVAERLEAPYTFTRLEAGVRVLRSSYRASEEDVLVAGEVKTLQAHIDVAGATSIGKDRLQHLAGQLKKLVEDTDDTPPAVPADAQVEQVWSARGLTVVSTGSQYARRKPLYDRAVFHRILRDLRASRQRGRADAVIFVAGADDLGLESLEALSHQARRVGVRLVLLMKSLREDVQPLLGAADSTALIMRLGPSKEAAAAADFIGKNHKITLSQVTVQIGRTFTEGSSWSDGGSESRTHGTSTSVTENSSVSFGSNTSTGQGAGSASGSSGSNMGRSRGSGTTWSESESHTRATTWQDTVNHSTADSTSASETRARGYEYDVEPNQIQALPETAALLIDPDGRAARRIVPVDCNPGITLLDGVSDVPHALPAGQGR
ncbi:hypothetical protein [Promicromonospora aerolata]|uniref:Uncharacterized protein n=1 Tax=Promicromonospora aerolata TaxID=195749 RepID=A0ABW4V435_9MICO